MAHAAPTWGEARGAIAARDGGAALAGGASVGVEHGALAAELGVEGAAGADRFALVRPALRVAPGGWATAGPHVLVGAGAIWAQRGARPAAALGAGYDLAGSPWRARISGQWVGGHPREPWRALISVAVLGRRDRAKPATEPAPEPVGEALQFDGALVWVPGPTCAWLPPDDAARAFVGADPRATPTLAPPSAPSDEARATLGDLVIGAHPGDAVWIDEQPAIVGDDGVAALRHPEGPASITVVGGGRRVTLRVAVARAASLWVDVPAPAPARIRFPIGAATVDREALAQIQQIAEARGEARFVVWGSASPEGDAARNAALADARAEAVLTALIAAGLPRDRIRQTPARPPEPNLPISEQRAAVIDVEVNP